MTKFTSKDKLLAVKYYLEDKVVKLTLENHWRIIGANTGLRPLGLPDEIKCLTLWSHFN